MNPCFVKFQCPVGREIQEERVLFFIFFKLKTLSPSCSGEKLGVVDTVLDIELQGMTSNTASL